MRKIRIQNTKPKKEKHTNKDEIDFWDLILEASRLGLFPKIP
ncbi:MAG: hypothetical protein ACFFG0_16500 [Candidatus Thorarchaeota archaeon]